MSPPIEVTIIGAGPYGLSTAAFLRTHRVEFRIFGNPMHSWQGMPAGMFLKSEGFASNLYDPAERFTLGSFCAEAALPYRESGLPVPLQTFTEYGQTFQRRMVPQVEEKRVLAIDRSADHRFHLRLDDGETLAARNVVVAVGMTHFAHLPASLGHLPPGSFSHSSQHRNLSHFGGHSVTVIGGGASALDLVASLYDSGADVTLVARRLSLRFNISHPRPWWRQWYPASGLGDGWRNQFYERGPMLFRRLPAALRVCIVRAALGPAGGFPVKDRVERVPVLLGHSLRYAKFCDGGVQLELLCADGAERTFSTEHVIAATGYRVDLRRLSFLSHQLRRELRSVDFSPVLSADFEASIPGLYFVGLAAANTFGPAMRFLLGARYTARRLADHFAHSSSMG